MVHINLTGLHLEHAMPQAAQFIIEKNFGYTPRVLAIHNDLIIAIKSSDEHDEILINV